MYNVNPQCINLKTQLRSTVYEYFYVNFVKQFETIVHINIYFIYVSVPKESGPRRGDIPWQWNYSFKRK